MSYLEDRLKRKNGILPPLPTKREKKPIAKKGAKKLAQEAEERAAGTDNALDRWFEDRRREMTGKCSLCPNKSYKNNDERYRWSCHHLLDKRKSMFPSLALHPVNFLEVCHNCHQDIHSGRITFELLFDSAERDLILPKLKVLLPLCNSEEKKRKVYSKLESLVYSK